MPSNSADANATLPAYWAQCAHMPAETSAVPAVRAQVLEAFETLHAGAGGKGTLVTLQGNVELALTELLNNAVRYGCPLNPSKGSQSTCIQVQWWVQGGYFSVRIAQPVAINPSTFENIELPSQELDVHGRGLYLIQELTDTYTHWHSKDGYAAEVSWQLPEGMDVELLAVSGLAGTAGVANVAKANETNAAQHALQSSEWAFAEHLQRTLLTRPALPKNLLGHCFIRHAAAAQVSGDYVEVLNDSSGATLAVMVDVMGKGVSAAMLAMLLRTLLHTYAAQTAGLAELVQHMNTGMLREVGSELTCFATAAFLRTVPQNSAAPAHAEIVNAGHCPIVVLNEAGTATEFPSTMPPLGWQPKPVIDVQRVPLTGKETFVLYTDGVYDIGASEAGTPNAWGYPQWKTLLTQHAYHAPEKVWKELTQRLNKQTDPRAVQDDQTLCIWNLSAPTPAP